MKRRSYLKALLRFLRSEEGTVLILFAVLIPVMMGIIGLVLDGGRAYTVNNELQDLADAAALAGAKELDGTQSGMDAASVAAVNLLRNDPRWSNVEAKGLQIQRIRFCKTPLANPDPWQACTTTADPKAVNYVEVTTIRRDVSPVFTVAVGATGNVGSQAIAIAGTTVVACNVQPLMLCNPTEPAEFTAVPGQMFVFKQKGGGQGQNPAYVPGDFGLLDPPGQDSSTGPQLRNLLSRQSPKFCYINNVSPRPGQSTGNVDTGINVRFDQQPGPGQQDGLDLTPGPVVIDGMAPKNKNNPCGPQQDLGATARMPQDTGMQQVGTLLVGTQRPTVAAKNAYWQYHHNTNWPANLTTRYEAYLSEIELMKSGTWGKPNPPEPPAPSCAPANVLNKGDAARRIISVAIVDCQKQGVHGNAVSNVRSDKYAEFFLTEPASGGTIYTEFVRMLTPDNDDGKLHRIVQLYR
ncbi:Flp pilus assembly protein TadG [Mesorhizobium soli]|uniref:pilus assembly protein n=1 Tax=Pseudaminobacter soli (ex Li et al. 2025) TaxID=1295366 RepID=UPI00247655C1|nr:pilus assembly protein [Mesorhizobium soli]MDH6234633.1 Flp pilus assembly protein TadG [Mesorhizobium soli]